MYAKLKEHFQWLPEHESAIRKSWSFVSGKNMSNMFNDARICAMKAANSDDPLKMKNNGPKWLSVDDWNKLVEDIFATDAWRKKSNAAKNNRLTEKDGSITKHTGGSIPFREHEKRMKRTLGVDNVSEMDVFDRTHKRQKEQGDFVDSKSKRVRDVYEDVRSQKHENGAPIDQLEFDPTSWVEAIGGSSKGYVYGFGYHKPANEVMPNISHSFPGEHVAPTTSHYIKQLESRLDRYERKVEKLIDIVKKLAQNSGVEDLATSDSEAIDGSFRDNHSE